MLENLIGILILVIVASVLQANYKIPTPITLIFGVVVASLLHIPMIKLSSHQFDNLVILSLPLLIATDALKLKMEDIKQHGFSLFWVAVIAVLVFILVGVLARDYVLVNYDLSIAAMVMLFCMVSATDPITVSAVFSNFKVPHKLKVLTEGESLFNDATALIVFAIAMVALDSPEKVTMGFIAQKSFSVMFGAIVVGLIIGAITTQLLKLSDEAMVESAIIMLSAYASYLIAEHYHFSGILAVIVNILMANHIIQKILNNDEYEIVSARLTKNIWLLNHAVTSKENHNSIIKNVDFLSMFASAILFVSIAVSVNFEKMWFYRYEILAVFIASTVIRGIMMLKFALVSNNVKTMQSINTHWWAVLTFAGSKGALSILMVHMIPSSFKYKELFEHIIIGNIILSIVIYALVLAVIFKRNKEKFAKECEDEHHE